MDEDDYWALEDKDQISCLEIYPSSGHSQREMKERRNVEGEVDLVHAWEDADPSYPQPGGKERN